MFPNYRRLQKWIFLFCLELKLFAKTRRNQVFNIFINNSRSKQDKKISNIVLQTLLSRKRAQNSRKKILNPLVVGARQSFPVFRQITWFLGYDRAFFTLGMGFCIT